jgi:hypothetical protein
MLIAFTWHRLGMFKKLDFVKADNRVRPISATLLSIVMGIFILVSLTINAAELSMGLVEIVLTFLVLSLSGLFIFCLFKGFTTAWFVTLFLAIGLGPWFMLDLVGNLFSLLLLGLLLFKPSIRYYFYLELKNADGSRVRKPIGFGSKFLLFLLLLASIPVLVSFGIIAFAEQILKGLNP